MGPREFARAAQILTDSSAEERGETQRRNTLCVSAFILNSAVDLTAKNAKITKTDSYAWIA